MTAKEAYEKSKSYSYKANSFEQYFDEIRYNFILKKIKKQANKGYYYCKIKWYNYRIVKRLMENGYHIHKNVYIPDSILCRGDVVCWGIPLVQGCKWVPPLPRDYPE